MDASMWPIHISSQMNGEKYSKSDLMESLWSSSIYVYCVYVYVYVCIICVCTYVSLHASTSIAVLVKGWCGLQSKLIYMKSWNVYVEVCLYVEAVNIYLSK